MNDFREITERIKDILSKEVDGKVYDKHVADALGLDPNTVRVYKAANRVPYKHLIYFCMARRISIDWLLFGFDTSPKDLKLH